MSVHIAALQLGVQPKSLSRLDYYLRICANDNVKLACLGEYTIEPFFKELKKQAKKDIASFSKERVEALSELSSRHNIGILSPIVLGKNSKIIKGLMLFSPHSRFKFYPQNVLISYKKHWDESGFFDNKYSGLKLPFFSCAGLKIGAMSGYEAHFDECWAYLVKKGVHVVVVPSASTFASANRWEALLRTRAFTYGVCVLRVGRVGIHDDDDGGRWEFYGDSMLIGPDSNVIWRLGNGEELGIANLSSKQILKQRNEWMFRTQSRELGWL